MSIFVGNTAPSKIYVGGTQVSKVFVGDNQVRPVTPPSPVPSAYQQVEFIEGRFSIYSSNKYPRIDTGIIPSVNYFGVWLDRAGGYWRSGWANYASSSRYSLAFYENAGGSGDFTVEIYNGTNGAYSYHITHAWYTGVRKQFMYTSEGDANGGTMYLYDDTGTILAQKNYVGDIQCNGANLTYPLFVRRERYDKYYEWSSTKVYGCKIYNGSASNLVRDLIPCYRKSDGKTGMYDVINQEFLPNQATTVDPDTGKVFEFALGPDVL